MEKAEIISVKSFQYELTSDKSNLYSLIIKLNNFIEIIANQINK